MASIATATRAGAVHAAPVDVRMIDGKFYVARALVARSNASAAFRKGGGTCKRMSTSRACRPGRRIPGLDLAEKESHSPAIRREGVAELARYPEDAAPDALVGPLGEQALDEVQPRRRRGREVQMHARMPDEPALRRGVLVRRVLSTRVRNVIVLARRPPRPDVGHAPEQHAEEEADVHQRHVRLLVHAPVDEATAQEGGKHRRLAPQS